MDSINNCPVGYFPKAEIVCQSFGRRLQGLCKWRCTSVLLLDQFLMCTTCSLGLAMARRSWCRRRDPRMVVRVDLEYVGEDRAKLVA